MLEKADFWARRSIWYLKNSVANIFFYFFQIFKILTILSDKNSKIVLFSTWRPKISNMEKVIKILFPTVQIFLNYVKVIIGQFL